MTSLNLSKFLFVLRWSVLSIFTRNPKQHFQIIRLPLIHKIKGNPLTLRLVLRIIFPLKSSQYVNLMFAYFSGSNNDLKVLLKAVPSRDTDIRTLKIGRQLDLKIQNLKSSLEKTRLIAENFDLANSLYAHLELLSELPLEYYIVEKFGFVNIGLVIHTNKEKPLFLTKIKRFHNHPIDQSVEHHFYINLRSCGEQLKQFIPEFISMTTEGEFGFFTMNYVHGRKPQMEDIKAVYDFNRALFNIKYDTIKNHLRKSVQPFVLSPTKVLAPLSKKQNKQTIKGLLSIASGKMPDKEFQKEKLLIEKLVVKYNIHRKINIKEDLVLQHGDLSGHNCKINQEGTLMVYDWDSYTLGLPGRDLLGFIMSYTIDFNIIDQELFSFLKEEHISNYDVITCYLTLQYLNSLVRQPEGVRIEENWDLAIGYLRNSPLNG